MITEEQLAQLETLANAASQAPWEVLHLHSPNGESQRLYCFDGPTLIDIAHAPMEYVAHNANNLPFAAMAREMVPGLIGEVRRLREAIDTEIALARLFWREGVFSINTINKRHRELIDNLSSARENPCKPSEPLTESPTKSGMEATAKP